jgi:hypothetical protein
VGRGKARKKNKSNKLNALPFLFFTFLIKQIKKFDYYIIETAGVRKMKCGVHFMLDPLWDLDKF